MVQIWTGRQHRWVGCQIFPDECIIVLSWKKVLDSNRDCHLFHSNRSLFFLFSFVFNQGVRGNVYRKIAKEGSQLQSITAVDPCRNCININIGNCLPYCNMAGLWWTIDVCHVSSWSLSAKFLYDVSDYFSKHCCSRLVDLFPPRIQVVKLSCADFMAAHQLNNTEEGVARIKSKIFALLLNLVL